MITKMFTSFKWLEIAVFLTVTHLLIILILQRCSAGQICALVEDCPTCGLRPVCFGRLTARQQQTKTAH